ncbi:MAG: hypothetical protein V4714_17825 [Bacteroidota bacterium]
MENIVWTEITTPMVSVVDKSFSVDVVILYEGMLCIGCYDFENDEWLFHSDTLTDPTNKEFVWMYAPDALYQADKLLFS